MKKISYLILFVLVLGFVSCGKDGSEGPLGPRGERGERGEQGAKGVDGTLLRYGNGAPQASLGNEGDFYIDLSSSNLYGPKTKSSWGAAASMKGATGAAGAAGKDGSQFLAGTVVPTTQGKIGDFYFRTTTATLYGPKASSGWGAGVSLKGAKGDKGDKGDKGAKGDTGNADVKTYSFEITPSDWASTYFYGTSARWNRFMVDASLTGGADIRHTGSYATIVYVATFFDGASYSRSKSILPHTETFDTYAINFELDLKNAWILMSKTTNGINKLEVPMGQRPDKVVVEIVRIKTEKINLLKGKLDFNNYDAVKKHFALK